MIIDTHTHIYLSDYDDDRVDVIDRALAAGVGLMIMPGVEPSTFKAMKLVKERWPESTCLAVGLHPTEVKAETLESDLARVEQELTSHGADYVAVGEIGLDLHWDTKTIDLQTKAFRRQLMIALEHDLPVIIHSRDALEETLSVIASLPRLPELVFHSFGGTIEDVETIRRVVPDAYFGLNGVATFKNCNVRDAVPTIGLDRLVLETDSPWLAPVPHRGKRCEPAMTALTAAHLAAHLDIPLEELEAATTANARRLFRL